MYCRHLIGYLGLPTDDERTEKETSSAQENSSQRSAARARARCLESDPFGEEQKNQID
jgi:hypothetical protein